MLKKDGVIALIKKLILYKRPTAKSLVGHSFPSLVAVLLIFLGMFGGHSGFWGLAATRGENIEIQQGICRV